MSKAWLCCVAAKEREDVSLRVRRVQGGARDVGCVADRRL